MKRFKIEWTAENMVKPKIEPWVCPDEDERKRREVPALTTSGGWTYAFAKTRDEVIARFLSINGTRHAALTVTEA